MSGQVRTVAPARRLGDEWIWVGFRSGAPAEHAGLELERLHVDELARLLLQAAEFRLRGSLEAPQSAGATSDRRGAHALEFEAWRASLHEQLDALHSDGAALSPRLAELVGACLASAAACGAAFTRTLELAARSAPGRVGAELDGCARSFDERAGPAEVWTQRPLECARAGDLDVSAPLAFAPHARRDVPRARVASARAAAATERWPTARDLAQAARVLAPSARSHCALGRAHLAAGDAAAARGCFRAALGSTADARLQRAAQLALDELGRTPTLHSAVGAETLGAPHAPVPHH